MDSMITVELTTSAVETSLLSRVALKEIVYETRAGMGILLQVVSTSITGESQQTRDTEPMLI